MKIDPTYLAAIAAVISGLVALVATVVGPWVSYAIAKRQIKATTVSSNRQQWVNDLRDDICELLVYLKMTVAIRDPRASAIDFGHPREWMENGVRLRNRVALRLNPNEEEHQQLLAIIDAFTYEASAPTDHLTLDQAVVAADTLLKAAQKVLKLEWERVKAGD